MFGRRTKTMARTSVFISYSHRDARWLERLKVHLSPLEENFETEIWEDTRIRSGSKWREEIDEAIKRANVAVLIISADFLESKFIRDNELPPLLKAAEVDGALVLPIIAGPSLFLKKSELSQFRAVNIPEKPLISMTEGEQETTFLLVAERILERSQMLAVEEEEKRHPIKPALALSVEDFLDRRIWTRLVKAGDWFFDDKSHRILGAGPHNYLLSRHAYGEQPFVIETRLEFAEFAEHLAHPINKMNSGIIVGWNKDKEHPRYLNILISGETILIEKIGFNGGPVVRDFEHVTDEVSLSIHEGKSYGFVVQGSRKRLEVLLDGRSLIALDEPPGILGRVGLRPWRSQLTCHSFIVKQMEGGQ